MSENNVHFSEINAEEVLTKDYFPRYEQELNALWDQILEMNSDIYLVETINAFPFRLFQQSEYFWLFAYNALINNIVMIMWRIAVDDGNALTLKKLKEEILKNIREDSLLDKREFSNEFKQIDKMVSKIKLKVDAIRNNYLSEVSKVI